MPATFDLILRGGSVVNHDGIGARDIGVTGGRIAALGDLSAADAGEVDRRARADHPARRHRHAGAFPRAGRRAQGGPADRLARGGDGRRDRRVRDAQHRPADDRRRGARRQARARPRPHALRSRFLGRRHGGEFCRASRSWSACPARPASRCSWAPPPATCWSPTTKACAASSAARGGAPRSIRRTSSACASGFRERRPGDPSSHPIWRDAEAALSSTRRLVAIARETGALDPRPARLDRRGDALPRRAQGHRFGRGDAAPPDPFGGRLSAPRHAPADEPAGARCGSIATAVWAGVADGTADILGSDHAPHTLEEKARPYPQSPSGMPGVQTLVPVMLDHVARGRHVAAALHGHDQRRPGAALRHRRQGPDRGRLRRRFHHRRPEAPSDDRQRLDRLALRLDALCRPDGDRLAGRHDHPRAARDVGGRAYGSPAKAGPCASTRRSPNQRRPILTLP